MIVRDPCFDSLCTHNTLKNFLDVDQRISGIVEKSATENQTDLVIKNENLDIESGINKMEVTIKTECVEIKLEDGEGSDLVLLCSNNKPFDNSEYKDAEVEKVKPTWKYMRGSSSFTESQTKELWSDITIKTEKESEINEVEVAIKNECVEIKSEEEGSVAGCLTTSSPDYNCKRKDHLARRLTHKNILKEQMHKCIMCDFKTIYKHNLKAHQDRHKDITKKEIYKCNLCDFKSIYKNNLKQHQHRHKGVPQKQMYKCVECNFETIYKNSLKQHQDRHKGIPEEQMYKCDECDFKSIYKDSFTRHRLRHKDIPDEQMRKCDECNFKTVYKRNLEQHQLRHKNITEKQMYKCDSCEYRTCFEKYFARHQRKHKNIPEGQM